MKRISFQELPVGETPLVIMPDSQLEHVGGYTLEEVATSEAEAALLLTNELRALSSSYLSFNFPVLSA